MRPASALLGFLLAVVPQEPPKDAPPPPPEPTNETLHGLRVELLVPAARPADGYSLLVYFHGMTGNGKESVAKLAPLVARGFVIAVFWSKQGDWTAPEIDAVKAIAKDLVGRFSVARERRHAGGLWTGTNGLAALAFDEDLGLRSATWVNGSWGGGSVPKRVKEELAGLFLWGEKEGASRADRYRKSASMLADKARLSVARGEEPAPGQPRGREEPDFPLKSLPFWGYFMECMEGRFAPDRDLSFGWGDDLAAARALMGERKTGGFAYVYAAKPEGAEADRMKVLQNEVLFDRVVRHFADQLVAVRLEKGAARDLLDAAKVTETPAIVVFKRGGKEILKAAGGEITAKALVPLLRAVAPEQEMPK
jgi:hypothetical protein